MVERVNWVVINFPDKLRRELLKCLTVDPIILLNFTTDFGHHFETHFRTSILPSFLVDFLIIFDPFWSSHKLTPFSMILRGGPRGGEKSINLRQFWTPKTGFCYIVVSTFFGPSGPPPDPPKSDIF
jgi:hypothetical protein